MITQLHQLSEMSNLFKKFQTECLEINKLHNLHPDCEYVSADGLEKLTVASESLNVMHCNIRSLCKKYEDLGMLLENLNENSTIIHVIMLFETFLNKNSEKLICLSGYKYHFLNREDRPGGGVAILLHESVVYKKSLIKAVTQEFECLLIEVVFHGITYHMSEMYRIPNTNPSIFINAMQEIVSNKQYNNLIIGTDQNLDFLSVKRHPPTEDLFEKMIGHNTIPCITLPTRVTHQTSTLIDNMYCKLDANPSTKSYVLLEDISDHYPCITSICCEYQKGIPKSFTSRKFTTKGFDKVNQQLLFTPWDDLFQSVSNVNDCYDMLIGKIMNAINLEMPEKTHYVSDGNCFKQPWMCTKLDKFNKKCKKLYVKQKHNPCKSNVDAYVDYNRTLKQIKHFEKRKFYLEKFAKIENDSRSMWNILNSLMNKRHDRTGIPFVIADGKVIEEDSEITNAFNDYFFFFFFFFFEK